MQNTLKKLIVGLTLTAIAAFGQSKPQFEVATIKPSAPLDIAKLTAAMQAGGKMPIGANVDANRAEYIYLDLKSLISLAYAVRPYQITGPDWLGATRFDIVAKMPAGAKKEDAPQMLQALLEDRFKLTVHKTNAEHPVLALVGKGGPKLKPSAEKPVVIDEAAPLKPGELKMDGPDGPVRMTANPGVGAEINMGLQGKMSYKVNPATQSMRIEMHMVTMKGFADMTTQLMTQLAGGAATRQIVDMTEIKGNYEASLDISLQELMALVRSSGMDIPGGGGPGGQGPGGAAPGNGPAAASDPNGGTAGSLTDAVAALGLKLESRKAMVEQLIVDHAEKAPTDN